MSPLQHPLLTLTPQARRHLARTLHDALAEQQAASRAVRLRHGALSAGACLVAGGGLGLGWQAIAGGELAPFALWYGLWFGIQAGVGRHLAERQADLGPAAMRWAVLAPYEAAAALRTWAWPERVSADRLVLASGLLVAIRRPVARQLVRRLVGRAYPQGEVDAAIALLLRTGYLTTGYGEAADVLRLTPEGVALLRELGVSQPAPRPQRDPAVAEHLKPLFARLEQRGMRQAQADVALPQLRRPAVEAPPPAPEPLAPWEDDEDEDETPIREKQPLRLPWKGIAAAVAGVAIGALAFLAIGKVPAFVPPHQLIVSASSMPHSQGTALQFNGRGLLLSAYGGGLFLSVPERLDYKRPLSFKGFDMATSCGLLSRPMERVSVSPHGRFLWVELGGASGPIERCLVDLETKTVTHDPATREPIYGLPGLVGWAGPDRLVLSEEPEGRAASRWWAINVTSGEKQAIDLPRHSRQLALPVKNGAMQLLGLDMHQRGVWDMTTYWLEGGKAMRKIRTVRASFPESLKEAEPLSAALSPDKRFVLLALRQLAASAGALAVTELADGRTVSLEADAPPLPDQPIFWGPDARGGLYRFYFNSRGDSGISPWTGELKVKKP